MTQYGTFTQLITIELDSAVEDRRKFTFVFDTEDDGVQTVLFDCDAHQAKTVSSTQLYAMTDEVGEHNTRIWQEAISHLFAEFG